MHASYILGLQEGRALPAFRDVYFEQGLATVDLSLKSLMTEPRSLGHIAAVSHRWKEPGRAFDESKTQQLRGLLAARTDIELVWIDWSSLPQGTRGELEEKYFTSVLLGGGGNSTSTSCLLSSSILYACLTVVIMVD